MLTLKQRLRIAYATEHFPERKRVVDLLKLVRAHNQLIIWDKEYLSDKSMGYQCWLGDVSLSITAVISEPLELYINGEVIDTSDCADLVSDVFLSMNRCYEHDERRLDMDKTIDRAIHHLLKQHEQKD